MPASRSARAMIFAPRSCPSSPGLATTTRILRSSAMKSPPRVVERPSCGLGSEVEGRGNKRDHDDQDRDRAEQPDETQDVEPDAALGARQLVGGLADDDFGV